MSSVQELLLAAQAKQKPSILSQLAEVGQAGLDGYSQGTKLANTQSDTRLNIALEIARRQQAEEAAKAAAFQEQRRKELGIGQGFKVGVNDGENKDASPLGKLNHTVSVDEKGYITDKYEQKSPGLDDQLSAKVASGEMTLEQAYKLKSQGSGTGMTPYQEYQVKKDQQEVNANQQTSAIYGTRAMQAQKQMEEIVSSGAYDPSSLGAAFSRVLGKSDLTNGLRSEGGQTYDQAADNLIAAILRKESGANITPQERTDAYRQYIIRPGDKADVIAKKNINRETAIKGLLAGAKNAQPLPEDSGMGAMIDANADTTTVPESKTINGQTFIKKNGKWYHQ